MHVYNFSLPPKLLSLVFSLIVCFPIEAFLFIFFILFLLMQFFVRPPPACSMSELSSLHDGEAGFHQTYRNIQKKALPPIPDEVQPEPQRVPDHYGPEPQRCRDTRSPEPHRCRDTRSPEPQHFCESPRSPNQYRDEHDLEPRQCRDETPPPRRRHSDDPPPASSSSSRARRHNRNQRLHSEGDEESHSR